MRRIQIDTELQNLAQEVSRHSSLKFAPIGSSLVLHDTKLGNPELCSQGWHCSERLPARDVHGCRPKNHWKTSVAAFRQLCIATEVSSIQRSPTQDSTPNTGNAVVRASHAQGACSNVKGAWGFIQSSSISGAMSQGPVT
ncbi:hypothetical protein [Anaplasma marginale]|uniref:hypothetical protein n=1 Tax=Anaplasma marginale TaxID=770 RepID=UPI001300C462|nr:hypothetical protein [Anaplasma marginale]